MHRTEVVNYNPMVIWKSFEINSVRLNSGNNNLPLKLVVKDYAIGSGEHKIIGSTIKTFNELISVYSHKENQFIELKNAKSKVKGLLRVMQLSQGTSL